MKRLIICLFFTFISLGLNAQKKYFQAAQIGTSYTYMTDTENLNKYNKGEQVHNWSINIASLITPRIQVGLEYMNYRIVELNEKSLQNAFMFGGFTQYNHPYDKRLSIYGEVGYYMGNYCSCSPYQNRKDGLRYLSTGVGIHYRAWKGVVLEFGFNNYNILNKIPEKYNNTRYVLGINYRFGKY